MPSKKRQLDYNSIHHIYNRGVLKKNIFHTQIDYKRFIGRMYKYLKKYPVDIHVFCILPNHFHFIIREIGFNKPIIPLFMQNLQSSYAKYYMKKYGHPGRVFQGTYKSKFIKDDSHYEDTLNYIRENPVKHGLAKKSNLWKFRGEK